MHRKRVRVGLIRTYAKTLPQEVIDRRDFVCMVLEYCSGGTVYDLCERSGTGLPEERARKIFYQAALGMRVCMRECGCLCVLIVCVCLPLWLEYCSGGTVYEPEERARRIFYQAALRMRRSVLRAGGCMIVCVCVCLLIMCLLAFVSRVLLRGHRLRPVRAQRHTTARGARQDHTRPR